MGKMFWGCYSELLEPLLRKADELGWGIEKEVKAEMMGNTQKNAHENGVTVTKASPQHMPNPEKEDNVLEQVNYDDLIREVAGIEEHAKVEGEGQIVPTVKGLYPVEQKLLSLSTARDVLEQQAPLGDNCRQAL